MAIEANTAKEQAVRTELEAISAPRDSALYWVHAIQPAADSWEAAGRRALAAAIRLGAKLLQAKDALPHGEFGRLFSDHVDAVPNALTFSTRWAQKLMAIASNLAVRLPDSVPKGLRVVAERVREFAGDAGAQGATPRDALANLVLAVAEAQQP